MHERIKQLIIEKGLQPSSFADKIDVSRGTISHILNRRNAPGTETIEKILRNFPDISSSWLIRGEGPMLNRDRIFAQPTLNPAPVQPGLFDENKSIESSEKQPEHEYSLKEESKKPKDKADSTNIKHINLSSIPDKKINKIMIFFSDKTYMTFIPEE